MTNPKGGKAAAKTTGSGDGGDESGQQSQQSQTVGVSDSNSDSGMGTQSLGDSPFTLTNCGGYWIVYDLEGHGFAGGEQVQVDSVDKLGQREVRNGFVLCQDADGTYITFARNGTISERPLSAGQAETLGLNQATSDNVAGASLA